MYARAYPNFVERDLVGRGMGGARYDSSSWVILGF